MDAHDIERQLFNDIFNALTQLPHDYGLPSELDKDGKFLEAWYQFQSDYAEENAQRLVATIDLPERGSERWDFMVHETTQEFDEHVTSMERMSLTVPRYIPLLVRHLAEGPRQMGEAITQLVVQAFVKKPEPQGILERIESRLNNMENRLQALDKSSAAK